MLIAYRKNFGSEKRSITFGCRIDCNLRAVLLVQILSPIAVVQMERLVTIELKKRVYDNDRRSQ